LCYLFLIVIIAGNNGTNDVDNIDPDHQSSCEQRKKWLAQSNWNKFLFSNLSSKAFK
jgi:hypothetical protein